MIKTFCNRCGKVLKCGDCRKVELAVRPYTTYGGRFALYGGRFALDFCESCFREFIGEEEYTAMTEREAEHKKRVEERKKERENNGKNEN